MILCKYGEIILKGKNRPFFERYLVGNIKKQLGNTAEVSLKGAVVYITPKTNDFDVSKLTKIFGITKISVCDECSFEDLDRTAIEKTKKLTGTFKVKAKRENKSFPKTSPEIERDLGEVIMREDFTVDIHNPQTIVYVEVRNNNCYIATEIINGAGGMPVGTAGRGLLLLSGGIDSPVAGYYMAKRGLALDYIHFATPPFTTEQSKDKVIELAKIVSQYNGKARLFVVPFTEIQMAINQNCPTDYGTILGRRFMMRVSEEIAKQTYAKALITGESLAQVASQTLEGLIATDSSVGSLVFRPLIGLDKDEIIEVSKKMGAFETSILPFDDCCSVFSPKRPKTHPDLAKVEEVENVLDIEELVKKAVEGVDTIGIG